MILKYKRNVVAASARACDASKRSVSRYAWGEVSIDGDLTFGEIHTLIDTSIKKPLYRNLHIEMENLAMDNQL